MGSGGGAGLFSTLDDYAAFCSRLLGNGILDRGPHRGVRVLSRKTMELAPVDSLRGTQVTTVPATLRHDQPVTWHESRGSTAATLPVRDGRSGSR